MASPLFHLISRIFRNRNKAHLKQKKRQFSFDKRQKFAIGVVILSLGLFGASVTFNEYGILLSALLALFSDIFLFWAIHEDMQQNFSPQVLVLPFLYSLSFGLFSFLAPARLLTRLILTTLYAVGLYSVFLSENIFIVASIRTIALLNSARIVSLVISLITFFFLTNTTFSLRLIIFPTLALIVVITFLLTMHAIWTYTLEKSFRKDWLWIGMITVSLTELFLILWFWPTSPTVLALFLTSIWYVLVGLSHVWLDKRLFRNVLWEYLWVAIIALSVLISFTKWQ
jgi:hypothetical protein